MKKAIVVGSGAGGATAARELQGAFQVIVLEAGNRFRPVAGSLSMFEKLKKSPGLFSSEKRIEWLFPSMKIALSGDGMVLARGLCHGGSTTLSTGSVLRQDQDLRAIGIDLEAEFVALERELPIHIDHRSRWHEPTRQAFEVCREMGLDPKPTPKMIRREQCKDCGRCILGCPSGAKWDSREFLDEAVAGGAELVSGQHVREVVIENGRATGVTVGGSGRGRFYGADLVVLAAGGLGTPIILQQSGIECTGALFVDPVFCVAAPWQGARQDHELSMPFLFQREHYMVSPYFDWLSFFFNKAWRYPAGDIFTLMIKLADTSVGSVTPGAVRKPLQDADRAHLDEAVGLCKDILRKLGRKDEDFFLGTLNAGHPGGMLPLTGNEAETLHHRHLPDNLYVADATLLPRSMGNPPILTIMALAKKVSGLCIEKLG